jgi:hypothetical protein
MGHVDPFTIANRIYLSHISGRANSFIVPAAEPFQNTEEPSLFTYNLNLTILPDQIIILPLSLEKKLNPITLNSNSIAIYSDESLR